MRKVIVLAGQTLWDIAMREYSGIEGVFWVMADNPAVVPDLDVELEPGTVLWLREGEKIKRTVEYATEPIARPEFRTVIAEPGQNLFDILTQELGGLDYLFDFLAYNPGKDVNSTVRPGDRFRVRISDSENSLIAQYFQERKIKVGSGDRKTGGGDFNTDFNEDFH